MKRHGNRYHYPSELLLARGTCIETLDIRSTPGEIVLLLARGACIETVFQQESQVQAPLLLARGACIETVVTGFNDVEDSRCSSQEEHVLKHGQQLSKAGLELIPK